MKVVVALIGPAALALLLASATSNVVGTTPPDADGDPRAVFWGGRLIDEPDEMKVWLRARGASYRAWAERHPRAAARQAGKTLTPRVGQRRRARQERAGRPAEAAPAPARRAAPAGAAARSVRATTSAETRRALSKVVLGTTFGLALLLLAVAVVPAHVLRLRDASTLVVDHQFEIGAAALSLMTSIALAYLLAHVGS